MSGIYFTLALLILALFYALPSQGQVFLGSSAHLLPSGITVDAPRDLSAMCSATFNETIYCSPVLPRIPSGYFPSSDELSVLCTSECLRSLSNFRTRQFNACTSDNIMVDGVNTTPTYGTDLFIFTYNYTCRRDRRTNEFCAPLVDAWGDKTSPPSNMTCSDCVLGTLQMQLNSPFGFDDELAETFTSMTNSCGSSNYPFTSPSPTSTTSVHFNSSATINPTGERQCSSYHRIIEGDDCNSISKSKDISTFSLLSANNLEQYCTNFPGVGFNLCIPPSCDVYTVQENDTCLGIALSRDYTFSITQLISWNPNINRYCSNLAKLNGTEICISYPGSSDITTPPSPPESTTTALIPPNVAPGTNSKCAKYYEFHTQENCSSVTAKFGIPLADFYFLNPEINSTDCGNLLLGYSYCVQAAGDISTYSGHGNGTAADPCMAATAVPSSCFDNGYPTTTPVPLLTATSEGAVPSALPLAPGTCSNCTKFVSYVGANSSLGLMGKGFDVNGCAEVASFYDLSVDVFVRWNPSLNFSVTEPSACRLCKGLRYCVAEFGYKGDNSTM